MSIRHTVVFLRVKNVVTQARGPWFLVIFGRGAVTEVVGSCTWCIVELQDPVLVTLNDLQSDKFVLISKWGCGGSTGQSEYKQRFPDQNLSDNNVFLSSLCLFNYITQKKKKNHHVAEYTSVVA